jgi:WD40 repeat protein
MEHLLILSIAHIFSINNTIDKDDQKSPLLLAVGNDNGKVGVYNYPSLVKSSKFVEGKGHSSHVTNVKWNKDDRYIISVGGEDQCLMMWRVNKKK